MLDLIFGWSRNYEINQTLARFSKISSYESGSPNFANAVFESIVLCQTAIKSNKYNGDAHVLLANAYAFAAKGFPKSSSYFLPKAFATIQASRERSMHIKNRVIVEISEKVYIDIVKLAEVSGILPLTKDNLQYEYEYAINSSNLYLGATKSLLTK